MQIKKGGRIYTVIEEAEDKYCVAVPMDFYPNKVKILELWWDKKDCEVVEEDY